MYAAYNTTELISKNKMARQIIQPPLMRKFGRTKGYENTPQILYHIIHTTGGNVFKIFVFEMFVLAIPQISNDLLY